MGWNLWPAACSGQIHFGHVPCQPLVPGPLDELQAAGPKLHQKGLAVTILPIQIRTTCGLKQTLYRVAKTKATRHWDLALPTFSLTSNHCLGGVTGQLRPQPLIHFNAAAHKQARLNIKPSRLDSKKHTDFLGEETQSRSWDIPRKLLPSRKRVMRFCRPN